MSVYKAPDWQPKMVMAFSLDEVVSKPRCRSLGRPEFRQLVI